MIDAAHATVAPCNRGVIQLLLRVNDVDQNGWTVRARPTDNHTLSIHYEAGPSIVSSTIVRAYCEVVTGGCRLEGCANVDHVLIIAIPLHACIMEGNKHELHTTFFVLTEKFRVPEVVADKKSAGNIPHFESDKRFAGTVVPQVTTVVVCARAEHLVISGYEFATIVNDIEGVVRLMLPREPMIAPDYDPQAKILCERHDLAHALGHLNPVDLRR